MPAAADECWVRLRGDGASAGDDGGYVADSLEGLLEEIMSAEDLADVAGMDEFIHDHLGHSGEDMEKVWAL